MSSDLFTLRHALQNAADDRDAADKGAAFTARVRREITALFEDPECPRRRHSFAVIRQRLGVFDENDPELREILFSMGAQVCKGKGEAAIWELIHADTPAPPPTRRKRPLVLRLGLLALLFVAVLLAGNAIATSVTGTSLLDLVRN